MSETYSAPVLNLKAVVQETGVKPDTLRAWERRYGLPRPKRTGGGHRLYSQRDVDVIKWLVARQKEGVRIGSAVELYRQLLTSDQDSLPGTSIAAAAVEIAPDGPIPELREAWISACLAFDERRAEQLLTQAFALYPAETVCLEVLSKGLAELGEGWYAGDVMVQQEHFASALALRRLDALIVASPPPTRAGRILVACPPEEEHCFSLALLTFLLRRQGWDTLYLGANVPLERMEEALETTRPQLVILAAQQLRTAATLLEAARFLQHHNVAPAFGGRIFNLIPALRSRIPGHFLGTNLDAAPAAIGRLMARTQSIPDVDPTPAIYRRAAAQFRERQPQIESDLAQALGSSDIEYDNLVIANREMARNIVAALQLGDPSFLEIDMTWLRGLLRVGRGSNRALDHYLAAYHQVAQAHLDSDGEPILKWLGKQSKQ